MPSVRSTILDPEVGWYTVRLVSQGPKVPARLLIGCCCTPVGGDEQALHDWTLKCDRRPQMMGVLNGEIVAPEKVWNSGSLHAISKEDYELLLAQATWDAQYRPEAPLANPRQKVDFNKLKAPF